ncbi:hypothetical protein [Frigoriglobus tundricola]|uniref:Uncharacterized protein n=1 Tax=Frigoriglobus tundricola TaxID=2774151 RepID=A0A6M5YGJ1_9BACT|nr:hypothetical protein [Frigoriglobus tundricola]QJW93108.1 hypothetical protein FTUN_0611 [Frigoriglobus tundricola]QJX01237.1 hypothetical protein FTUN_8876 [Frigoriglobus tundricola]
MQPDYAKWDNLLRTSKDRAQAEQIARAWNVPIRPEPPPPPDLDSFAAKLAAARIDPALWDALAEELMHDSVSRQEVAFLIRAVAPELHAHAKTLPSKRERIELLRQFADNEQQ